MTCVSIKLWSYNCLATVYNGNRTYLDAMRSTKIVMGYPGITRTYTTVHVFCVFFPHS